MKSRGHGLLLLAASVALACAPSPSTLPAPANVYARIPAELSGFRLTERTVVRGMPSDSVFRFRDSSSARVTLIIYNIGPNYRDGDLNISVMREGQLFSVVQDAQKARGTIADFTVSVSDTATIGDGPNRLFEHRIVVQVRAANGAVATETQNLYAIAGRFVKVRATIPQDALAGSGVPAFARALALRLSQ